MSELGLSCCVVCFHWTEWQFRSTSSCKPKLCISPRDQCVFLELLHSTIAFAVYKYSKTGPLVHAESIPANNERELWWWGVCTGSHANIQQTNIDNKWSVYSLQMSIHLHETTLLPIIKTANINWTYPGYQTSQNAKYPQPIPLLNDDVILRDYRLKRLPLGTSSPGASILTLLRLEIPLPLVPVALFSCATFNANLTPSTALLWFTSFTSFLTPP